jgi:hypothetical protein
MNVSLRTSGTTQIGSNGTINGVIFTPQLITRVRWEWLAYLAAQIVLTAVVVGWTASLTKSSGVPDLKDSAIATMCALDYPTQKSLGALQLDVTSPAAGRVPVRLEKDRVGSGFAVWLTGLSPRDEKPKDDAIIWESRPAYREPRHADINQLRRMNAAEIRQVEGTDITKFDSKV